MAIQIVSCAEFNTLTQEVNTVQQRVEVLEAQPTLYKDKSGVDLPAGSKVAVPADVTDAITTAVAQASLLDKVYHTTTGAIVPNNGVVLTPTDLTSFANMLPALCQDVVTYEDSTLPTLKFKEGDTVPLVNKTDVCYLVVEIDGQAYRLIAERITGC